MKKYLFLNIGKFFLLMLLKFIYAASFVGFSLILQWNVNVVTTPGTTVTKFLITVAISILYCVLVVGLMMLKDKITVKYINNSVFKLRQDISNKLLNIRYCDFTKNDSSLYLSRLTNDMKTVSTSYFSSIMALPDEVFTFFFATIVAFYINYAVALVMLGLTLLIFIVPVIFNKPLNKTNMEVSNKIKDYTNKLKQTFLGMDVLKNFNAQKEIGNILEDANRQLTKKTTLLDTLNIFSMDTGILIVVLLQMGSIAMAGFMYLQNVIMIGAVIAVVQLASNMYAPLMNFAGKIALITGVKDLNETILKILDLHEEKDSGLIPLTNEIDLNDVSFSYADGQEVVKNVSVKFEEGKKYLIIGSSGSGKSTLLKLVGKMYADYLGDIKIGGIEYNEFSEKQLYQRVSFAQQSSYVFDRTVRQNIDFNNTQNQEELNNAIALCCLEQFVNENGLDNVIDEEVNKISGGEKQRIGLARAIYRNTPILLLDEVTASLDRDTAFKVESNLLSLKDKMILNVSHKIYEELIIAYDKVLILEKGQKVFFDSPKSFIKSQLFRKYVKTK